MNEENLIPRQPPPLRSTQPAVDIPGFFDAVEKALLVYIKADGTPDNTTPIFVHEFPKERLAEADKPFDIITFKVLDASMAPTMNDGSSPRGPKRRQIREDPKKAGYNLDTYGWWELVQAEFSIWSKSNRNADAITAWFHLFMMKYAFVYKFFMSRGVEQFRFVCRRDDDRDTSYGQEVYRRRLVYEFRLESLFTTEVKQFTELNVNYGVSGPNDTIVIPPPPE
jgi:hypothetical protein